MYVAAKGFLVVAAAAALIHGLDRAAFAIDEGGCCVAEPPSAPWMTAARAEMKANASLGIAFVLPADDDRRSALRAELAELLKSPTFEEMTFLVEAVYVVGDLAEVGGNPGDTVVLLGADGARVAGTAVPFTRAGFAKIARDLLRADGRLAKRAAARRDAAVTRLLADLDGTDAARRDEAAAKLVASFASVGPVVIDAAESAAPGETRARRAQVIAQAFQARRGEATVAAGRALPFGVRWKAAPEPENAPDPCPACGMMVRAARALETLEFAEVAPASRK